MKKITLIFLSFVIYFNSITLANAAVGGWSLGNPVAVGASTVYEGTKNIILNGKSVVQKGVATIAPNAMQVSKVLARGVAGAALSVAVEQLLGAVDWVLDPANNSITYTEPQPLPSDCLSTGVNCPSVPRLYTYSAIHTIDNKQRYFSTAEQAGTRYCTVDSRANMTFFSVDVKTGRITCLSSTGSLGYVTILSSVVNPAYDPQAVPEDKSKSLPLEVVAAQVISNAEGNTDKKSGAQVATMAAAADVVAEADTDETKARPIVDQLNNSSSIPTTEAGTAAGTITGTKTDPVTGETVPDAKPFDMTLTFPVFCSWAPTVCKAAETVISFPQTLTDWWTTGKEKAEGWATSISESWTEAKQWASSETKPEEKDTEVETIDEPLPNIDTGIFQASGQCPPDFSYPFPLPMGGTYTVTYSYATACYWLSKLYYIVVSVAWVIAFRIVTNTNTGNSENG